MAYTVVIAGTTKNTALCAAALHGDPRFTLTGVLTPEPKLVGRKQILTKNPLHKFAETHDLNISLVEKRITDETRSDLEQKSAARPDFLLVVDFGYIVPKWLLEWPTKAPLNVHPSALPKWRGSSPGQFSILYGDKQSAVTLMIMNESLDEGPVIIQHEFEVDPNWTQQDYYQHSFKIVFETLADDIAAFAAGELTATPQPDATPTPIARRLSKADAFVSWTNVLEAMNGEMSVKFESKLLEAALGDHSSPADLLSHAARALNPWPQLWTEIPTSKGKKRMKILSVGVKNNKLELEEVQVEGQTPANWNQVRNLVI